MINQKIKDLKKVLEKVDIDKWIEIRLKYLKIQLEKSIKNRMSNPAPYRFVHHRVQEFYNILQMAKAGDIKVSFFTKMAFQMK